MPRPLVLAGCLILLLGGCSKSEAPSVTPDAGAGGCSVACEHLIGCESPSAEKAEAFRSKCLGECAAATEPDVLARIECVRTPSCDRLSACFGEPEVDACGAACTRIVECANDPEQLPLSCACDRYSSSELTCIAAAACDNLLGCLTNDLRTNCQAACARIAECRGLPDESSGDCVDQCVAQNDAVRIDCLTNAACSELDGCDEPLRSPCDDRCLTLLTCQQIESDGWSNCVSACEGFWEAPYIACIDAAECTNLVEDCGAMP